MFASVLIVLIFGTALGVYIFTKRIYVDCVASTNLQRDISVVARKMTQGIYDGGALYGLTSATSYTRNSPTQVSFSGSDGKTRKIYLKGSPFNQIIYTTKDGNDVTLYTAPSSSTLTLLFWPARFLDGTTNPGVAIPGCESLGFYISVLQQVMGHNASSSLRTTVNLRGL